MVENFANVARTYAVRTVSVYAARPGDRSYSVGNALFPVENNGRVTLPDALGQQLGLTRVGRHQAIEGFDIDEATGELRVRYYPGREPQPSATPEKTDPTEPAGDASGAAGEGEPGPPNESQSEPVAPSEPAPPAPPKAGGRRGR